MKSVFKFSVLALTIASVVACSRNEPVATEKVKDEQRPPEAVRLQPVNSPNQPTNASETQLLDVQQNDAKSQGHATIVASDEGVSEEHNDEKTDTLDKVAQNQSDVVAVAKPKNNGNSATNNSSSNKTSAGNTIVRKETEPKATVTRTNNTTTTITTTVKDTVKDTRLEPAATTTNIPTAVKGTTNQTSVVSNKTSSHHSSAMGPAAVKPSVERNSVEKNEKKIEPEKNDQRIGATTPQRTQTSEKTTQQKPATTLSKSNALMDDVRPINNDSRQYETDSIGSSKSE